MSGVLVLIHFQTVNKHSAIINKYCVFRRRKCTLVKIVKLYIVIYCEERVAEISKN